MGFSGFIKGLVLVLMASSFVRPLMADPRANVVGFFCNSSQAANATLRASFAVLSLSNQSAGIDENGLGITVSGEGPNAVFGLAQCYKDLTVTDCKLCYSEIRNHITKCFPRIEGRVFLDGCFSRTGNYSFFNEGIDSVNLKNCSSSKNHSQPDKLNQVLRKVIGSVSLAKKRTKGFAVASHSISNLTVYALVQCWETLDENTCNSCIQVAASSIMLCSPSVEGRSLHASCYMRYSTELFWNLNPAPPRSSGTQKILWIILGAAIGGFLVLTGIGFWIANRYFCRSYGNSSEDLYGSILPASIYQSKLNFSHKELRRATKNFDSSNKLGQGSYGSVYKGVLPNGREVTVKRLFLNTRQWVDQFFNEVNLINQVRHKNLVKLLGCSVSGPESLLVYKYYFNRSLDHFIFEFIRGAVLIFMASSFFRPLMADPRTNVAAVACGSVQAVSPATFATNAVIAMNNEISLVYQNGFGTTSAGEAPNTLFGLAQCYRDLSSTDCKLCYNDLQSIIATCFPKTGGRVFLDGCFARYENFSFFNQGIDSVIFKNCSSKNHSQLHKLNRVLKKVIGTVSLASRRIKGFAVASDSISSLTVYALSQCWESLDEKTCTSCLQAAASSIMSCSPSVEGRSLNAGCYMRYSTELFWNLNQTTTTHLPGTHKRLLIILGSALVGFLALSVIGFWKAKGYLCRAYRKSLKDSHGSGLSTSTYLSKLNFRYKELKRATNNFDSSNKVGQGSYGSVYKGVLPNGREVAVKRLFLSTTQWVDQFFNEVNMINQLRHKNLVKLLGCSVDGPESLLVFKYYFNKSLDHFIFGDENQAKLLDWQKRVDIIQGVADGLSYLHEESEIRVIHRDIKASNILLDDKFKPKITDFGLARSFTEDQTHISTGIAGTLGYMAPEYVVHGHLTEKADVYSFGVLILEIMTGQRCNNGFGAKPGQIFLAKIWSHYKARTINKIIDGSFYEDAMEDDMLHVVHVGLLCTQATPCYRPTMAKVAELLRNGGDRNDVFLTEPPFLDVIAMEIQEEGEGSHLLLASSFSGPS